MCFALEIWLYTLWLFFSRISYQCLVWNNYGWVILQNAICPPAEFNLTLNLCHTRIKAAYKPTSSHPLLTAQNLQCSSTSPSAPLLMTARLLFKMAWSVKKFILNGKSFLGWDLISLIRIWLNFEKSGLCIIANFAPLVWPGLQQ